MPELHPVLERELRYVDQLELLEAGELVVDHEVATLGGEGALIVTDRRVLFVRTTLFRRRRTIVAHALGDVADAQASPVWGLKGRGELTLVVGRPRQEVVFGLVHGGEQRAAELAASVLLERDRWLERESPH